LPGTKKGEQLLPLFLSFEAVIGCFLRDGAKLT